MSPANVTIPCVTTTATQVRDVEVSSVRDTIAHLLVESNYHIPAGVLAALRHAAQQEESPLGRRTLDQIIHSLPW